MTRNEGDYVTDCSLYLRSVTVEDAGKYKVTARNDLGESNATISLNFDSKGSLVILSLGPLGPLGPIGPIDPIGPIGPLP
jgi:Immunoglobulin I-set domain